MGWCGCRYLIVLGVFCGLIWLVCGVLIVASLEICKIQPGNFEEAATSYGCWQHLESFINTAAYFEKCSRAELQIRNVFHKSR